MVHSLLHSTTVSYIIMRYKYKYTVDAEMGNTDTVRVKKKCP